MFPPHRIKNARSLGRELRGFRFQIGDQEYVIPEDEIYTPKDQLGPGPIAELVIDGYWAEMSMQPDKADK